MDSQQFQVGDKLVYPNHGIAELEHVGGSPIMPDGIECYHLRLLCNNSRLVIPLVNKNRCGLRRPYQKEDVAPLFRILEAGCVRPADEWRGRYRENLNLMATGRLEDVAEVLKDLTHLQQRKSLTFRERTMFARAKYLLVSEMAWAMSIPEPELEKLVVLCIERSLNQPS